jgi:hypothetical protein
VPLASRGLAGVTGMPLGLMVPLALSACILQRAWLDKEKFRIHLPRQ